MKRFWFAGFVLALMGCGPTEAVENDRRSWRLPIELSEISGLAVDADGRLLAHDDERGWVRTIDALGGAGIVADLPLDDPPPPADFEGIAAIGARVYLITSAGELFDWTPEGLTRTALEPGCEVEGLTEYGDRLVAVCKQIPKVDEKRVRLLIIDPRTPVITARREIPLDFKVRPSGIEWEPATDTFYVLAARPEPRILVIDADENVRDVRLAPERHQQPEGIALVDDGWFIADEGRPGLLTYRSGRP